MFRSGGGFITSSDEPIMIGQVQVLDIDDMTLAIENINARLNPKPVVAMITNLGN